MAVQALLERNQNRCTQLSPAKLDFSWQKTPVQASCRWYGCSDSALAVRYSALHYPYFRVALPSGKNHSARYSHVTVWTEDTRRPAWPRTERRAGRWVILSRESWRWRRIPLPRVRYWGC